MKTIQINHLMELLKRLELLLVNEGEDNWIRGIRSVIRALDGLESSESLDSEAVSDAVSIYKTMSTGVNSFSDFCLWRDDPNERREANRELDELRDEIWRMLVVGE